MGHDIQHHRDGNRDTDLWTLGAIGYRDGEHQSRRRLAELLTRGQEQLRNLGELARLHGRRTGRIAGGTTAVVLGLAFMAASLIVERRGPGTGATLLLLASAWGLGLLAAGLGRLLGRRQLLQRAQALVRPTGDLHRDLARLELTPRLARALGPDVDRLELASLALPLVAVALLAPLTLHLPFASASGSLSSIDMWCKASVIIVGHAHLVLAGLFVRHALKIRRAENPIELRSAGWRILGLTVVAAAVPGLMLLGLPPLITAVTGALFIPYAAARAVDRAIDERDRLAEAVGPEPGAVL